MPYFQDATGKLHFLSEEDLANNGMALLPSDCEQIADERAAIMQNPPATARQLRAAKLDEINTRASEQLAMLSADYPPGEVQSWAQQTREAEAVLADPGAEVPLLSAIAVARGLTTVDLAERVAAKTEAFAVASGAIIGKRQALEDAIVAIDVDAPGAEKALAAIHW